MGRAESVRIMQRRRHYLLAQIAMAKPGDPGTHFDKAEVSAIEFMLDSIGESVGAMPDPKKYKWRGKTITHSKGDKDGS